MDFTRCCWFVKSPEDWCWGGGALRCARDNLWGQKSLSPLKMSLEMPHKVIVPQKKNFVQQFLKQRDINSFFLYATVKIWKCSEISLQSCISFFIFHEQKIYILFTSSKIMYTVLYYELSKINYPISHILSSFNFSLSESNETYNTKKTIGKHFHGRMPRKSSIEPIHQSYPRWQECIQTDCSYCRNKDTTHQSINHNHTKSGKITMSDR
jgi:hypothetical protein